MRVAVTGGTGFIGSHLVKALAARGDAVRCLLRPSSDRAALPAAAQPVVAQHLADPAALERLLRGADAVVHLAGLTRSWTPRALHEVNRGGTAALCAVAARAAPALQQLIIVSSQAAVGASSRRRPRREDDRPAPVTAYGRSKLAAERVRLRFPRLPVTVVRPPSVYGPGDRDIFAYFRLVHGGLRPELVPASRLSMVYVGNLVDALLLALDRPQHSGQRVYHVADHGVLTMNTVALWIAEAYGRRALRVPVPQAALAVAGLPLAAAGRLLRRDLLLSRDKLREIAQPAWLLATSRIAAQLGYRPRLSTRDAIALTARWYLDHGWLRRTPAPRRWAGAGRVSSGGAAT
ncbi:MAG: NAD-dependent epimerase/dehydratase family protein [Spirochaetaceae bacterium]|nr:NAD-dependent epimerase/dehydratase family protein [Spirochaetaceae bacterium]